MAASPEYATHWALVQRLSLAESRGVRVHTRRNQRAMRDLADWGYAARYSYAVYLPTAKCIHRYFTGPWKVEEL